MNPKVKMTDIMLSDGTREQLAQLAIALVNSKSWTDVRTFRSHLDKLSHEAEAKGVMLSTRKSEKRRGELKTIPPYSGIFS